MRYVRGTLSVLAVLWSAVSVSSAACPAAPPSGYQYVSFAGANCSSALGGPCAIAQPLELTLTIPSYAGTVESCDVVTWHFGDGTSQTTAAGVASTMHSYASAGNYVISTSITNGLGTQGTYVTTTVSVGAGFIYMPSSFQNVNEGAAAAVIVRRTTTIGPASVHYATADQSAIAGQQYVATAGTLTFADGEGQKTITIPTLDDHVYHSSQFQFRVDLSAPTDGYTLTSNTTQTISLTDTDPRPTLSFELPSYTVAENVGSLVTHVIRSGDVSGTVSVVYGGPGYTYDSSVQTGIITFFPNETSKTITLPIVDDDQFNGNRSTSLFLRSATNGGVFPNGSPYDYTVPLTIVEDEAPPTLTVRDLTVTEGAAGVNTAVTVNVTLSTKLGFSLQPSLLFQDGSARSGRDYVPSTFSVFIPAGSTTASFTVQIVGNARVEPNKTFTVSLQPSCCSTNPAFPIVPGKITIVNDDAEVSPGRISISAGGSGSVIANFGASPASPQTVLLSSSDPSVAGVPSSVVVTNPFEVIPVTGNAPGQATITATVPAAYGGGTFTTAVNVYDGAVMVLSPATVSLPVGGTATITATMSPALTAAEGAALKTSGNGAITAPNFVTVDAGGSTTFTITGVRKGSVELIATLGGNHGSAVTAVLVEVTDPPATPSITQISPANGPAAGGTAVTINGANLRSDCTIRFGGVPAADIAFVSVSSLTATAPEHAAGAVDVALSCGSENFTLPAGFNYLAAAATLSNVTPSFGTTAGKTLVRITGTNIASGCWPFFDGIPAPAATVNAPADVVASTPVHTSPATVPLTLRCSGAPDVSLVNAFTYTSAAESGPVITAIDPLVGSAGKIVTMTGVRFRYDDAVTFGDSAAAILYTSPSIHIVRIPELPLGKASITVTEPGGRSSSTGPIFTIVEPQPPQIVTVSPGTTRPANEITLDGSGFRPGYSFMIGDQPAMLLSMTYARVVLRVPQVAAGSYAVNVLNAASKIAAIGPQVNVLAGGLSVSRVTPSCLTTEGGARMTINGTGFAPGAVVTFDGAVAAGASVTDAQTITLTLPSLPAGMPRILVTNPNGDSASLSSALAVHSPFDPNGCSARARPARH
jgi:hypothetical protein